MYFLEVKNKEELNIFLEISNKGWEENNWKYEIVERQDVKKFLVLGVQGNFIGTFEIIPFQPEKGTAIDDVFLFSQHPEVLNAFDEVIYELDKLTILREHRGVTSIILMFEALLEVSAKYKIDKYLTLPRHSFFRLLHRFKLPIKALGEAVIYEPENSKLIPSIVNMEEGFESLERLKHNLSVEIHS